jgi:hypothetical protein
MIRGLAVSLTHFVAYNWIFIAILHEKVQKVQKVQKVEKVEKVEKVF